MTSCEIHRFKPWQFWRDSDANNARADTALELCIPALPRPFTCKVGGHLGE